jgi:hypothetical protein
MEHDKIAGLTRREFLALPMEERRRRLEEQAKQFVQEHGYLPDDPCDGHSTMIAATRIGIKCPDFEECANSILEFTKRDKKLLWDWLTTNAPELLLYPTGEPLVAAHCTNKDLILLVFKTKVLRMKKRDSGTVIKGACPFCSGAALANYKQRPGYFKCVKCGRVFRLREFEVNYGIVIDNYADLDD